MTLDIVSYWLGWLGVALTAACNIPQLLEIERNRTQPRVSRTTHLILFAGVSCYLIRAIAIQEPVFIVGSTISMIVIGRILGRLADD